jgi:hypothetical protein
MFRLGSPVGIGTAMAEEPKEPKDELDPEDLEREHGEPLPDREVMSTVRPPGFDPWNTLPIEPPATE